MEVSPQCIGMDPLFNTPVKLTLRDISQLEPFAGSKVLFTFKGHPVNYVDVVGIVTEVKNKEDSVQCSVDDGTGSIQCFCPIQRKTDLSNKIDISSQLLDRIQRTKKPCLGDIVHVIGSLKIGLWSNSIYVTNCKWSVLDDREQSDAKWLQHVESQVAFYEDICKKSFAPSKHMKSAIKSVLVNDAQLQLPPKLELVMNKLLMNSATILPVQFSGFELMELSPIQAVLCECFEIIKSNFLSNKIPFTQSIKKLIASNAIAAVLHAFVASGQLIKKKCLPHECITKNDQMDATYFVTTKCTQLLQAVQSISDKLKNSNIEINAYRVQSELVLPDFLFLRTSKHGTKVIKVALEQIET